MIEWTEEKIKCEIFKVMNALGIKRMPSDESFSLKIYFNKNEEIETIQ